MYLYTMQSGTKSSTYVTKWDIRNSYHPVQTEEVSDRNCGPLAYSESSRVLAIGSSDGNLIFVNGK